MGNKTLVRTDENSKSVKVEIGDQYKDFRGRVWRVTGWSEPLYPGAPGRVRVSQVCDGCNPATPSGHESWCRGNQDGELFPSVLGLEWGGITVPVATDAFEAGEAADRTWRYEVTGIFQGRRVERMSFAVLANAQIRFGWLERGSLWMHNVRTGRGVLAHRK